MSLLLGPCMCRSRLLSLDPQCTSLKGLMVSVSWYRWGIVKGSWGVLVIISGPQINLEACGGPSLEGSDLIVGPSPLPCYFGGVYFW